MEARDATRKTQLLQACPVAPESFQQVMPRLHTFMAPFVAIFPSQALHQPAETSVCGLLSDVERKTWHRSRSVWAKSAGRCNASWAGQIGRPPRCARH